MYKNIYVLVDIQSTDIGSSTLDEAFALAKFSGAKLKVKHFIKLEEEIQGSIMDGGIHFMNLEKKVQWFIDGVHDRGLRENIHVEVDVEKTFHGDTTGIVLNDLKNWDADLVIMGCSHKLGSILHIFSDRFIEKLSNKTRLPILLVHACSKSLNQ